MKVEKQVGWITGLNGTGIIYEVSHNGGHLLANIWQDGKFHFLSLEELGEHLAAQKASLTAPRNSYLKGNQFPVNSDGSLPVENPAGWLRLYEVPGESDTNSGGTATDEIAIPVEFNFSGVLKLKIAGLSQILKFVE